MTRGGGKTARRQAGQIVRERRERGSLSQLQLSKRLKVSQSAVSHVEQGRGSPELTLQALKATGSVPREIGGKLKAASR